MKILFTNIFANISKSKKMYIFNREISIIFDKFCSIITCKQMFFQNSRRLKLCYFMQRVTINSVKILSIIEKLREAAQNCLNLRKF